MLALHYPGTSPDWWEQCTPEDIATAIDVLDEMRPEPHG